MTPECALDAADLLALRDPADQIIFATAARHEARIVTRDAHMHELDASRVIW